MPSLPPSPQPLGDADPPQPQAKTLGGLVHAYQRYDPSNFPPPTRPPPDVASAAFEHMLRHGSMRRLTPEELARAVRIDPSQIAGLGPSLEAIQQLLEERKAKILSTYETERAKREASQAFAAAASRVEPPPDLKPRFDEAVRQQQIRDLERLWYAAAKLPGGDQNPVARGMLRAAERLGEQYLIEDLISRYTFTGREGMDVPKALAIREELLAIDRLLEQLKEAMKNAQIGVIDMEALADFVQNADIDRLNALRQQVEDYIREQAALQGLEMTRQGYQLTPEAYRIFQGKLLQEIFSSLQAARSGRHQGPVTGEGAVELPRTRPYAFGDSPTHMDVPQTVLNAAARSLSDRPPQTNSSTARPAAAPARFRAEDIEIYRTRNTPKCATAVLMDMSGSMRYDGQYINAKRMALALDGLIRREYPGDFLAFFEVYTFAKPRPIAEVPGLLPKPVTVHAPVVRLKVDMSKEDASELAIPPHFTNLQHALHLARRTLSVQDTPNRQIVLLTDGLPTAHFEGAMLYLLYPPDPRTEEATLREGMACKRDGITINIFLLPNWSQRSEDIHFAHRLAEQTGGRVFFTGGRDVDRFVLWDYVSRRRKIIG